MTGLDPVLRALQSALSAKPGGVVPLNAATLGDAGASLITLFTDHLCTSAIVLPGSASITADDDADTLTVSGPSTTALLGMPAPAVVAVFSTTAATSDPTQGTDLVLQVELTVATVSGWTLATSFPMLGKTNFSQVTFGTSPAPRFRLRSQPGPSDVFGVVEPVGLSLEASVVMASSPPLASMITLVPGWSAATIPVAGRVATSSTDELLALRGPSLDQSLKLPFAVTGLAKVTLTQLALSLTATAGLDVDDAPVTGAEAAVWGTASLSGTTLPLGVTVPFVAGSWTLGLLPGSSATLTQVLGMLTGIPLIGTIPDAVKNAVSLPVTTLSVSLNNDRSAYLAVNLVVQSDNDHPLSWTLVPGVVELTSIGLGLNVTTIADGTKQTTGWVAGTIALDSGVTIGAMVTLPLGSGPIRVSSNPNIALTDLKPLGRLIGGGGLAELLPGDSGALGGFQLAAIAVTVNPAGELLSDVSAQLTTTVPWPVIPGQLVLQGLMIAVDIAHPLTSPQLTGQLVGRFMIGKAAVGLMVGRAVAGGDWTLSVQANAVPLPSISDLAQLAGTDVGANLPATLRTLQLQIGSLELEANLSKPALEVFSVQVGTVQPWQVVPSYLELTSVSLGLTLDWRSGALAVSGFVIANIEVADTINLIASAVRNTDGSWVLSGALKEPVSVGDLAKRFFGQAIPAQIAGLKITTLAFTADTGASTYTFDGALTWPFTLGDIAFQIDASATISRSKAPGARFQIAPVGASYEIAPIEETPNYIYTGKLAGSLQSHFGSNQLKLGVSYTFSGDAAPVYGFVLGFNRLALTCTLTKNKAGDSVLTAALTGVSFGDVVTFLVDLVDPSLHFSLSSPWDVLNQIRFDDFSLVANLTQRTIGLSYQVNKNLGLVDIDTITLTYLHKGGQGTVDIAITGRFLDQTYPADKPLTWDLLNDTPPATPGAGAKLFDLKYLGIGQHLVLVDPKATTMPQVIADLKQTVLAAATDKVQPWDLLKFDASSGWLAGAQFVIMDTFTLGLVFNDPVLYGVQISLAGEKAGIFAGLDFQILYRKVTDTIGVYHIELKLPDVMRHLEFGEVSITLPIVIVDIYTNGDFKIDFGFPYNNDWTVCFGVEVFPFTGAGGFYFAKLSAATATGLPQITNGTFNPVIEFGLALAIGVGKQISAGPLKAGLSVEVQGVLQGTIAPFNPSGPGSKKDLYYWIKGSIAIVGKLYGIIDFKIITVELSIVAYASATLIIEAYQPILIELSVGVSVTASIKILFIRVHFTFKMRLDASFTIGSASTPPWTLAGGSGGSGHARGRALGQRHRRYAALAALAPRQRYDRGGFAADSAPSISWNPVPVLGSAPVPIPIRMMPVLTVAGGPSLSVEAVLVPFVATTAPPDPATAADLLTVVAPEGVDPAAVGFNRLVEAMLRWGVQSLLGRSTGPVTAVDLALIYADLGTVATAEDAFGSSNLAAFLAANVILTLNGPGASNGADMSGAALPIMPPLQMSVNGAKPVQFWQLNQVGPDYLRQIAELIASLTVPYGDQTADDPTAPPSPTAEAVSSGTESLPSVVFDDYWLMLAKAAVQAGVDALRSLTHATAVSDSLATLAATYAPTVTYVVRAGDTAALIAAAFGVAVADLVAANPTVAFDRPLAAGTSLTVPPALTALPYALVPSDVAPAVEPATVLPRLAGRFMITPTALQDANPDVDFATAPAGTMVSAPIPLAVVEIADANLTVPLAAGVTVPLAGARYRTLAQDTLTTIAVGRFGLPDVIALATANAADPALLLTGATLTLATPGGSGPAPFGYVAVAGDTATTIAAYIQVRNAGVAGLTYAPWFANAVAAANPDADPTVAGTTLTVPTVEVTEHGLSPTGTTSYVTKAGDDLTLVAGYAAALQTAPDQLAALAQQIEALNPTITVGATIQIPVQHHVIGAGETLAGLAARFGLTLTDLATVNATAAIVAPSAELSLPATITHTTSGADTLSSIAAAFDLTLDDLIGRLAPIPGLLGAPLTIPDARQADLDELITSLEGSGATNQVAGMTSRFLLHGLDLPDPAGGPTPVPFAVATGQQTTIAPAPAQPPTAPLAVELSVPNAVPWLALTIPYTTQDADTLDGLVAKFSLGTPARLEALNPGVDWTQLPAGTALAVPQPSIDVGLSVAQQTAQWPAPTFDPEIIDAPAPLPLAQPTAVHYAVSEPTTWQAAVPPVIGAGPALGDAAPAGQPMLWPLPPDLLARLDGPVHPYALMTGTPTTTGVSAAEVARYAWATQLPVVVRRVAASGDYLPNTYQLLGVPQSGRDQLLQLWSDLAETGQQATIALLYPAPGGSGSGLRSDAPNTSLTAVLRTNLSTDTHSGVGFSADQAADAPPAGAAYASLAAPGAFLQQLWECSVTSSGGYYLTYQATGGAGLPGAVFAGGEEVTLQLVVLLAAQTAADPDRSLYPFTNAAVVLDAIDPGRVSVYAEATDDSDLTTVATAPQGSVGFAVSRRNASLEPDSPAQRTAALAGLLGWSLTAGGGFTAVSGLPVGPTEADEPADRRPSLAAVGSNASTDVWFFHQVVPVARFAQPLPALPAGMPSAATNPYAGLGGTAGFALEFGDLFGNAVGTAATLPAVSVPVGYTDDVQGVASWPGASATYDVRSPDGTATFGIDVTLSLARYLPSAAQTYQVAARAAAAAQVRYRLVSYQLHQADLTATVRTTLDAPTGPAASGPAVLRPLRAFADAGYLFLQVAQSLQPVEYAAVADATPGSVCEAYGVTPAAVGLANATGYATEVFATALTVVQVHTVAAGDTFAVIAAVTGTPMITILGRAANAATPLTIGAVLVTAPEPGAEPPAGARTHVVAAGDTFASIAAAQQCTIAGLATANATRDGLLTAGTKVTVFGATQTVQDGDTLRSFAARWAALDLPVGVDDVAAAAQELPELLVAGKTLIIVDYVVAGVNGHGQTVPEILAAVPGLTLDALVTLNADAPDLYPAGTGLDYGTTTYQPLPGETIAAAAAAVGNSVEQLLAANTTTGLRTGATLTIPGTVRIDDHLTAQQLGYTVPTATTLTAVATTLGATVADLAQANATMPGLFAPGVALPTSPPLTTADTSTFASLAAAAQLEVGALAALIADTAGLIAAAALVVVALPVAGERTFSQLATDLGVSLAALATANAPLAGLVRPGAVFSDGVGGTVTAGPLDTLASIAFRLAGAHGVPLDAVALVAANATTPGLLGATSPLLAPPADAQITAPIPAPVVPAPIFPLTISVTLARDPALVAAEFADAASVHAATTDIAPSTVDPGAAGPASAGSGAGTAGAGDAGVPSLIPLATAFEAAFAPQRLALASGPVPGTGGRQVWVIDFGADGFAKLLAQPEAARYFALAPLSTEPLAASGVPVAPYDPATGTLGTPVAKTFAGVDVDAWLATLLTAIDAFLTPQAATAAYSLGAHEPLESVVTGKQSIAAALRSKVAEILVPPETTDGSDPALMAAQEALYQSMLIALGTAYSTDAIIEVPFTVGSPYGQPAALQPSDTWATLAARYEVSPAGVALGLADAGSLLAFGTTVAYAGHQHTIQASDTLRILAAVFGCPVAALPAGLSVVGGGSLFGTTRLPQVSMRRTPGVGDSIATVARYLGVDPATCGIANSDQAGLIEVGTVITLGGHSHTAAATDTLTTIAAALGIDPGRLASDPAVRDRAGILSATLAWHAISSSGPIAPRIAGQAVPVAYVLSAGATFADIAAHYAVSGSYLASFLASQSGLIATGISLGYGAQPAITVAPGATPASLAAHFATTVLDLLGAPVLEPGVGLFTTGYAVPLTSIAHVPGAEDSFASLAQRFQTTIGDVAVANQDVVGLLRAGSEVKVGDATYTVTATDRLLTIAAALHTTPDQLALQPTVAGVTGWFGSTVTAHVLQPTPASAFSTAKTSLTDGTALTSVLFSTSADAAYRSLSVDLDYPLDEIEFGIDDVALADGYQSSQWLRPVLPITSGAFGGAIDTDLGQLTVPLPLRGAPTPPVMTGQGAVAAVAAPTTIAEAKQWLLDVTFDQHSAAQDDVYLSVDFGAPGALLGGAVPSELFAALAQFTSVWPQLEPDVVALQELPLGSADPVSTAVAETFAALVSAVATALSRAELTAEVATRPTLDFRLDTTYDYATAPITLSEVTFVALPSSPRPGLVAGLADPDAIPWPDVYLPATGETPRRPLDPAPPQGASRAYRFPPGVAAFTDLALEVVLPGGDDHAPAYTLDVAAVQQANALVRVTRNEHLIYGVATAAEFVYTTGWASTQSPAIPSLLVPATIDVGDAQAVEAAVTAMLLEALTPPAGTPGLATLTLGCRYAQPLTPDADPPIVAYLPVLHVPHTEVGEAPGAVSVAALAAQVSAQVAAWATAIGPRAQAGDAYVFELTLFGAADATLSRPLVALTGLRAPFPAAVPAAG